MEHLFKFGEDRMNRLCIVDFYVESSHNAYDLHGEFPKIVGKPHKMGLGIKTEVFFGFFGSINPIKSGLGIFVSVQIMARPSCEPIMLNPDLSPKFNVFWGKHGVNFEISIFDPQKALPCMRPHFSVCSAKKSGYRCWL